MQPGAASPSRPPEFPDAWCGLWKDNLGKIMYIRRIQGRSLAVSFCASVQAPFNPLPDVPGELSHDLAALYLRDATGVMHLRVEAGAPGMGPWYKVHFIFGEGDRLRPAEPWDMVSGVIARPAIEAGNRAESEDDTRMSWALPLSNFWKMEEDEAEFFRHHTL